MGGSRTGGSPGSAGELGVSIPAFSGSRRDGSSPSSCGPCGRCRRGPCVRRSFRARTWTRLVSPPIPDYALNEANIDNAIADFARAIEINPRMAWAYYNRGSMFARKSDLNNAVADFTRAIEIDSGLANAYADRGLIRLRQGMDADAENDFAQCLARKPEMRSQLETLIRSVKSKRTKQ